MLDHLGLKVPFLERRPPVKLPSTSDVPLVSYLTADEARSEATRLAGMDLAWWDLFARKKGQPLYRVLGGTKGVVQVGADFGVMDSVDALRNASTRVQHETARGNAVVAEAREHPFDAGAEVA